MNGEIAPSRTADDVRHFGSESAGMQEPPLDQFSAAAPSVGRQLRTAREAKGLSVDDVSRALKLSHRQVESLEAEDWPSLPGKTMIRGFVRNYARLLNLNSELLMSSLDRLQMPLVPELEMDVGTPVNISHDSKADRRDYVRVLSGLIILVFAVLAYFLFPQDLWQSTLSALKAATQSNEPAAEKVKVPEASGAPQATVVPLDAPVMPLQPVPVPEAPPEPQAVSGNASLKFSFARPAWLEVRDRSGQVLFSQLNQAGSEREIQGQPPFALIVGNASHVTLQYKSKPVDLGKHNKDDVARITLE